MTSRHDTYLVTGAAGFIGSAFVHMLASDEPGCRIVAADALTYAGNILNISELIESRRVIFEKADITDSDDMTRLLDRYEPKYVVNFAAETHVDRSVDSPAPFINTNINGTFTLLECCRRQRRAQLSAHATPTLTAYLQVSTDEVYGDLELGEPVHNTEAEAVLGRPVIMYGPGSFREGTPVRPSSPYSASKASADFIALSYHRSFGLPVIVSRCSNNYGPRQFPEKLIPLMINNILEGRALPVYGHGQNVRDWIHADDHCRGILAALHRGRHGEVYNFGGYSECRNIDLVRRLIATVADIAHHDAQLAAAYPAAAAASDSLISYVADRPGHDRRYAVDAAKAWRHLGWKPIVDFDSGLADTVRWYVTNRQWLSSIIDGQYRQYYQHMYLNGR